MVDGAESRIYHENMKSTQSLAERINARIYALGISDEAVADKCGVSSQAVKNWRKDAEGMGARHLRHLRGVLKCSVEYLLGISDEIA